MSFVISNNAVSRLVSAIATNTVTFSITGGTGVRFPNTSGGDVFHASLVDSSNNIEIVKVTSRVGDIFTVVRGQEGTTIRAFSVGDRVAMTLTAEAFNAKADAADVSAEIAAAVNAHLNDSNDAHDASSISYAGGPGLSATDVEGALDELATEKMNLTGGTVTGDIVMSGASIIEARGADVVAAAITDIWATDGNMRHITGNTTITSFGTAPQAGARMRLIFDGTPLLTHSPALNLNTGSANVQITVGDYVDVTADTVTQHSVTVYRKSGVGTVGMPQSARATNYTLALTDADNHIYSTNTGTQTITIPTFASVAFPVGTAVTMINNGTSSITISTASTTVFFAGTASTGDRTLAPKGLATIINVAENTWFISGVGLS